MPYLFDTNDTCPVSGTTRPGVCPVAHLTAKPATSQPAPFEKLPPKLARLPSENPDDEQQENFLDEYITVTPDSVVSGTQEYDERHKTVVYTRARLPVIDEASKDLWRALHYFRPMTANYAGNFQSRSSTHRRRRSSKTQPSTCPMMQQSPLSALQLIRDAFNWNELRLPEETEASFYGVIFRSKRAPNSESETAGLHEADKLSHEEAVNCGGLLMYWYGVADPVSGSNLATCIWRSREEARVASALPLHRQAVRHATRAYEDFELSRYKVVKVRGEAGVRIEEWDST